MVYKTVRNVGTISDVFEVGQSVTYSKLSRKFQKMGSFLGYDPKSDFNCYVQRLRFWRCFFHQRGILFRYRCGTLMQYRIVYIVIRVDNPLNGEYCTAFGISYGKHGYDRLERFIHEVVIPDF